MIPKHEMLKRFIQLALSEAPDPELRSRAEQLNEEYNALVAYAEQAYSEGYAQGYEDWSRT